MADKRCRGLALDIDETLSWTVGYWVEQMQRKFGNPERLSVKELISKYRYTKNVPYWHTEEAELWMEEQIHANKLQEMLPLIEDADTIVQKIHTIIPIILYVTVRPTTVLEGTRTWLRKHHFPEAGIIARPPDVPLLEGNVWKAQIIEALYPTVTGIVDDNPGLADALSEKYEGTVYLYDNTDHARKDIHVVPCKTWHEVLHAIEQEH